MAVPVKVTRWQTTTAKANRAATVGVGNQITLVCTPFISDALGGTSAREAAISD